MHAPKQPFVMSARVAPTPIERARRTDYRGWLYSHKCPRHIGYDTIKIRAYGHALAPARVIGVSSETDMALLKTDAENLPAAVIGTPGFPPNWQTAFFCPVIRREQIQKHYHDGSRLSATDASPSTVSPLYLQSVRCRCQSRQFRRRYVQHPRRADRHHSGKIREGKLRRNRLAIPIDTALTPYVPEYSLDLNTASGHLGIDFSFINTARAKKTGRSCRVPVESSSNDVFLPEHSDGHRQRLSPPNPKTSGLSSRKISGDTARIRLHRSSAKLFRSMSRFVKHSCVPAVFSRIKKHMDSRTETAHPIAHARQFPSHSVSLHTRGAYDTNNQIHKGIRHNEYHLFHSPQHTVCNNFYCHYTVERRYNFQKIHAGADRGFTLRAEKAYQRSPQKHMK